MNIRPSSWGWKMLKDDLHKWIILFGAPTAALITYVNVTKGQATLRPIPEGYNPREEEYYKSPITRWFVRNVYVGFQQNYEHIMHQTWQGDKDRQFFMLRKEVLRLQKEDGDYKGYYYAPVSARFLRYARAVKEEEREAQGWRGD